MNKTGFTLIEMLVTLSILAIVLAIAAPNFNNLMNSSNMVSNANGMIGAFKYARMEAIKRGGIVQIGQVGSDWTEGIEVWVNDGGVKKIVRLWPAFDSASNVNSSESSFSFNAMGEVDQSDDLTICIDSTGEEGMEISILISGAVTARKVTCV